MSQPRSLGAGLLNGHLGLVYAFLYVPILVLILLSFNKSGLPTAWGGVSFKWYVSLAHNTAILSAALNTLIVALSATFIACVLGTLLALGVELRRKGNDQGQVVDTLLMAPMIIPDIVLAIALLSFFNLLKAGLGLHSIIISHAVFNIAFVCAVVRTRLKHFDYSILEASIDLGAGWFTTFRRVLLPAIFPGVLAGGLLAFTLSVDEFIIAFFNSGSGSASTTLPMQIYAMIRFGVTPEINALATLVMLVSITALLASQRLNKAPRTHE
ncbi:spermidine/putrescine transport system permease protein [Pseudomonas sp. ok272]|uniref:ABC transporter permease n=1 Tax=unclassified Pseudomonas TaxID=196821 RepID=UPI0008B1159F|nr:MULTISPECIES: ABC transporter permease [unclassified Pseudomonas]SEM44768.1 spermidine/putrescine transport system permease protein [Pseudomonas sp. ok272]SFM16620.1 spermidine/putrescine transport system permease protein [Pseudomonas sp. ok602]